MSESWYKLEGVSPLDSIQGIVTVSQIHDGGVFVWTPRFTQVQSVEVSRATYDFPTTAYVCEVSEYLYCYYPPHFFVMFEPGNLLVGFDMCVRKGLRSVYNHGNIANFYDFFQPSLLDDELSLLRKASPELAKAHWGDFSLIKIGELIQPYLESVIPFDQRCLINLALIKLIGKVYARQTYGSDNSIFPQDSTDISRVAFVIENYLTQRFIDVTLENFMKNEGL